MTHRKLTLLVLLASVFTVVVSTTVLVVSLPTIASDLGSTVSIVSWTITAPMLSFGVLGPAFGKAGDLWGHRRVFVGGLLLSGIFSVASALSWGPISLIIFRTLAAGFGAASSPSAMAYINRMFDVDERVRPLSYWSFTTASSPVIGVVLGVPLMESIGWRAIFFVQGPLCILMALVSWKMLFETSRKSDSRFDLPGSVCLGMGSVLLLVAINRGSSWGWFSPSIFALALFALGALALFVRVEHMASNPLMPIKWLRTRNIIAPVLTLALLNYAYMGSFMLIPQMLEGGLGFATQVVGWLVIVRPIAFSLVAPLGSRIVDRLGTRGSGMLGGQTMVVAMLLLAVIRQSNDVGLIIAGLALTGIGLAVASPALVSVMSSAVPESDMGVASALMQLASQLGSVIGGALMIAIHESAIGLGTMESYGVAIASGAMVAVLAIVMAGLVRNRVN